MTLNSKPNRIFLSPPHMGGEEVRFVGETFESNYIAPLGPQVDLFEKEFSEYVGMKYSAAVSSGTAAMHLALRHLGVGPAPVECAPVKQKGIGGFTGQGDEVFASTLTFIGSVTPVVFQGATPVFIDCDRESWNMDPGLLEAELERCAGVGKLPRAVVPTDLYGQCCDLGRIVEICDGYGVPVICDSAEAMGSRFLAPQYDLPDLPQLNTFHCHYREFNGARRGKQRRPSETTDKRFHRAGKDAERQWSGIRGQRSEKDREQRAESREQREKYEIKKTDLRPLTSDHWLHAGVGAKAAVYSFNGNKIITTSGGGMLVSDDEALIEYARFLAQQAREDFPHYEHKEIGFNYRMSNVLAAIGRGQLRVLDERVKRKREIFDYYQMALGGLPGIQFMPEPEWSKSNRWLTVVLITPKEFGADREQVRLALDEEDIEARPVWKPMHMQPVFGCSGQRAVGSEQQYPARVVGGEVAEDLFDRGLCLPSGTAMTNSDLDRVTEIIRKCYRR